MNALIAERDALIVSLAALPAVDVSDQGRPKEPCRETKHRRRAAPRERLHGAHVRRQPPSQRRRYERVGPQNRRQLRLLLQPGRAENEQSDVEEHDGCRASCRERGPFRIRAKIRRF